MTRDLCCRYIGTKAPLVNTSSNANVKVNRARPYCCGLASMLINIGGDIRDNTSNTDRLVIASSAALFGVCNEAVC